MKTLRRLLALSAGARRQRHESIVARKRRQPRIARDAS